jgi:hypothetical protein
VTYWLDYSAAKLSGKAIRDAGYSGVIRYIDEPGRLRNKHTTAAEYQDHRAAGLGVLLVMQNTTADADGGFASGATNARRALAGAVHIGYHGPIFFTNDRTTVPKPAAWQSYLDGAASVLGLDRVGAYGFANALQLAKGHATYFWQAGRKSDLVPHAHIWQDNNHQPTVNGVLCDRNLILKSITAATLTTEDDMPLTADDAQKVAAAVWSAMLWHPDVPKGVKASDMEAFTNKYANLIPGLQASVAGLTAAVAALSNDADLTADTVKQIVTDAVMQSIEITGTVQVNSKGAKT